MKWLLKFKNWISNGTNQFILGTIICIAISIFINPIVNYVVGRCLIDSSFSLKVKSNMIVLLSMLATAIKYLMFIWGAYLFSMWRLGKKIKLSNNLIEGYRLESKNEINSVNEMLKKYSEISLIGNRIFRDIIIPNFLENEQMEISFMKDLYSINIKPDNLRTYSMPEDFIKKYEVFSTSTKNGFFYNEFNQQEQIIDEETKD